MYNYLELFIIQVGMETEGFAIYDAMMQLKNEVEFLVFGVELTRFCISSLINSLFPGAIFSLFL